MDVDPRPQAVAAEPAELARLYLGMLRIRLEDAVLRLFLANGVEERLICARARGRSQSSRRRSAGHRFGSLVRSPAS